MSKKIAVIGAGIAGLTCAYELQRAGFDVVVFEKEKSVGGRMRSREKDGVWFDIGATHLVPRYTHMLKYIEEFGIEWIKMDFEQYGLLRRGPLVDGKQTYTIGRIADQLSSTTKLRMAVLYSLIGDSVDDPYNLNLAAHVDTEDAYAYMKRIAGREAADLLGDGFTAAYQFHGAQDASRAGLVAILQSVKRERQDWMLHHTRTGMSALPEAFATRLDVRTGVGVKNVTKNEDGSVQVICENGDADLFDGVVLATITDVTKQIAETALSKAQQDLISPVRYASTVSFAFKIPKGLLPEFSITWMPKSESPIFSGISNEIMKGDDVAHDDGESTIVCAWIHDDEARVLLAGNPSDEELFAFGIREFVDVCPWITDASQIEPFDLERWTHAMPVFETGLVKRTVEYLERTPEDGGQGAGNIFLCGDYLNAPWTEGALQCGERVAENVVEHFAK